MIGHERVRPNVDSGLFENKPVFVEGFWRRNSRALKQGCGLLPQRLSFKGW
jgi:hypothetical protein